ncbi:aceric acid hydrolase [Microbacter margulisiae]|uniref:Glycoside hydrolase family 127 protein n=1 Tax=Microbacter margulisiae TaxID=1350067 RepID=A0A7W5DQ89_9PORP|nr:glycoside hydrolase family 127 protein [Microbacter margulisiae]MBB3187016.1 hypothetical protein [Microbacter margulisiae]
MNRQKINIVIGVCTWIIVFSLSGQNRSLVNTSQSPFAKLTGVNMGDVRWTKGFWADRFNVCLHTMSPKLMQTYMDGHIGHAIQNFEIAAGLDTGSYVGPPFQDGDFYKIFESLASLYSITKSKKLDEEMDSVISIIAKAQLPNGYINTTTIIAEKKDPMEAKMFADKMNFETYNMGHLMTAACIHYRATGKRSMLNIAIKAANYLCDFYKSSSHQLARNAICPSHYMGLIELYRTTHDAKYLELAENLINMRGLAKGGTDQNQDRIPFREQTVAMGHAVRANYLYAGVADLYAETGDTTLLHALNLIWNNLVHTKMYITGACGALYDGVSPDGTSYKPGEIQEVHQAYGRDYQLPNMTAYNESCANIGNLLFNWRMLQITGNAKYADVVETILYNSLLSGVSLNGINFRYTNPLSVSSKFPYKLRWAGKRIPYISLSDCCPPNITRTIAEVQDYIYGLSKDGLWINLYGGNTLNTKLRNGESIQLTQTTNYPWDGHIIIKMQQAPQDPCAIYLRIPGWCDNATVAINGIKQHEILTPASYVKLKRTWKTGDEIELNLPIKTMLIETNPLVEETRNQVAIQRGPVVYCLEGCDLPNYNIFEVVIPSSVHFNAKPMMIDGSRFYCLNGVADVEKTASWHNVLYREIAPLQTNVHIHLIPYFAWGNRGKSDMAVWLNLKR